MTSSARGKPARPDQQRYLRLMPIAEVKERIAAALEGYDCGREEVRVDEALGRVAAERIESHVSIPPASVAAMDGYALRADDLKGASLSSPVILNVKGRLLPADRAREGDWVVGKGEAYQVATGAPIPEGSDLVVRVEDTKLRGQDVVEIFREFPRWKNVSSVGEDVERGQVIVEERRIVNPADIALLIGIGRRTIWVFRTPKVGVLSIGSELKEFDPTSSSEDDGRTYNNYSNLVCGYLGQLGIGSTPLGVCRDDPTEISGEIRRALDKVDAICTIGGSSVGAADFTPDAASSSADTELVFHGVRLVPIRPAGMALAKKFGKRKPIVIIPGHAVSAALTVSLIVLPVVNLLSGLEVDSRRATVRALADGEFVNDRAMDALLLAEIRGEGGNYRALPLDWGSNLLSNLARANGFVHLKGHETIRSGTVEVELLNPSELHRVHP